MANYPAQLDTTSSLPTIVDNITPVNAQSVNRLRDTLLSIESELGVKPSGVYSTVRERLTTLETGLGNLQIISLSQDLGGTLSSPKVIGLQGKPIATTTPNFTDVLTWNGIAWAPSAPTGGSGSNTVSSPFNHGLLLSDGTITGISSQSLLLFDNTNLSLTGNIILDGYLTSGSNNNVGRNLIITSGDGYGIGNASGQLRLTGGSNTDVALSGGPIIITGGDGYGTGGNIQINGGTSHTITGGNVTIQGGDGYTVGGTLTMQGGLGATTGIGGDTFILGGNSGIGGTAGKLILSGGKDGIGTSFGYINIGTHTSSANDASYINMDCKFDIAIGVDKTINTYLGNGFDNTVGIHTWDLPVNTGLFQIASATMSFVEARNNGNYTIQVDNETGAGNAPGGGLTIKTANGRGTGTGGTLALTSGNSGTSNGAQGGPINITGGNSNSNSAGGTIAITAGNGGLDTGIGGSVNITAGNGGTQRGSINIGTTLAYDVLVGTGASRFVTVGNASYGTLTISPSNFTLDAVGNPMHLQYVNADKVIIDASVTIQADTTLTTISTGNINLPNNTSARFQIEGYGVGSTVTAGALDVLTAGPASNADGYHTHAATVVPFIQTFTNATLSSGILTVTHNLNSQFPIVQIYDNSNQVIIPNIITGTDINTSTIDLTGFGIISGTWRAIMLSTA